MDFYLLRLKSYRHVDSKTSLQVFHIILIRATDIFHSRTYINTVQYMEKVTIIMFVCKRFLENHGEFDYPFSTFTPDLNTSKAVVTFIPRCVICVLISLYGPAPISEMALT